MDFSAWNWATSFRLHEAACLIAGVMPISKRQPTTEELPSQARPILVKLMAAYVEWHLQKRNPDRPKSIFLEGYLNDDGALPEINSLAELPGALASREAINRFLLQIEGELGLKSAYDFGPICKTADPFSTDDQHPTQRTPTPVEHLLNEAPTPDEPALNAQTAPDDPERRLSRLRELGGSAKHRGGEWRFTGIAKLVASEKAQGRSRSAEKTIRLDLKEAAQNEREAKRAGFGSGLGQR